MVTEKTLKSICQLMALICLVLLPLGQSYAVWYEAKGQAVILKGNKQKARRDATEEALKQALLFAGASISSVQQLTNGLLESESITISSTGEVEQLELVDEVWHADYVTVTVRADIFARKKSCSASDYPKQFATSYFMVENRQHLLDGKLDNFEQAFTRELARQMALQTTTLSLPFIAPYTTRWRPPAEAENARELARQANTQFVIIGRLSDLSVHRAPSSALAFWKNEDASRYFSMDIKVFDGLNGGQLFQRSYTTHSDWPFDRFSDLDSLSASFWRTDYGNAITTEMKNFIADIKEVTACQPLTGRVLSTSNENLTVSLGRDNGVMPNDEVYIYRTMEVIDSRGQRYLQYNLYPGVFTVEQAYGSTSSVRHKDTGFAINVQENDFVIKK